MEKRKIFEMTADRVAVGVDIANIHHMELFLENWEGRCVQLDKMPGEEALEKRSRVLR